MPFVATFVQHRYWYSHEAGNRDSPKFWWSTHGWRESLWSGKFHQLCLQCGNEVDALISEARIACANLCHFWRQKGPILSVKVRVYWTTVWVVLLYGIETWSLWDVLVCSTTDIPETLLVLVVLSVSAMRRSGNWCSITEKTRRLMVISSTTVYDG